jgi:hypothetical protein
MSNPYYTLGIPVDLSGKVEVLYPLVICDRENAVVVRAKMDGSVEYGLGYTTDQAAARLFWEAMARGYRDVCLPEAVTDVEVARFFCQDEGGPCEKCIETVTAVKVALRRAQERSIT